MITSNNSMETLGSKISSVIYPKQSMEKLNSCSNICFESNDGVPCECITIEEHTKSETRKNPCRKNRPSSIMFDGVPIEKLAEPRKNWIWCPNSKHGTARCKMAIRNEHQIPAQKKLTMQEMFGHKRHYLGGRVPDKAVDVEASIRYQAILVRGKGDYKVREDRARLEASSTSAATTNQEVN
jgi:hypothetical protein